MAVEHHQTLIIGGGPAGSAAAIALARAGKLVCLLERKQGSHDKVCGEFISGEAAEYLRGLGIDLKALGAKPIDQARLYNGHGVLTTHLPFTAWSLSRRILDAALLDQAQCVGADVRAGVAVRVLQPMRSGWSVGTLDKQLPAISAEKVLLASGKHDLRDWRRPRAMRELVGLKMHLRLNRVQQEKLRGAVEVHLFNGGYAGLEPIEDDKANLCFLVDKSVYHDCRRQWSRVTQWLQRQSPHLEDRLRGAVACWPRPLAVYGTPYGFINAPNDSVPGLFRLGDQTAVIPSFAGDGIAIALRSGMLAADVVQAGGTSADYGRRTEAEFKQPLRNARALEHIFAQRSGRAAAFLVGRLWPNLVTRAIRGTRLKGPVGGDGG